MTKGIGYLETEFAVEGRRHTYDRIVGYLVDLEARGMSLGELMKVRGGADNPQKIMSELRTYVESGEYRKVCDSLLEFDGLFTHQMKNKLKNSGKRYELKGEKIVEMIVC